MACKKCGVGSRRKTLPILLSVDLPFSAEAVSKAVTPDQDFLAGSKIFFAGGTYFFSPSQIKAIEDAGITVWPST